MKKLSTREKEIITYMSKGFNNKKIGLILGINQKTISTYVQRIRIKLELEAGCNAYIMVATYQKLNFPVTEKND